MVMWRLLLPTLLLLIKAVLTSVRNTAGDAKISTAFCCCLWFSERNHRRHHHHHNFITGDTSIIILPLPLPLPPLLPLFWLLLFPINNSQHCAREWTRSNLHTLLEPFRSFHQALVYECCSGRRRALLAAFNRMLRMHNLQLLPPSSRSTRCLQ